MRKPASPKRPNRKPADPGPPAAPKPAAAVDLFFRSPEGYRAFDPAAPEPPLAATFQKPIDGAR